MKTKFISKKITRKLVAPVKPVEVDKLASSYLEVRDAAKAAGEALQTKSAGIKKLAESFGKSDTKTAQCLLYGKRYQIGYQVVSRSGGLDMAAIQANKAIWRRCLSAQFDEVMFTALIKDGTITPKMLRTFTLPDSKSQRIVVDPLGGAAKPNDAAKYED